MSPHRSEHLLPDCCHCCGCRVAGEQTTWKMMETCAAFGLDQPILCSIADDLKQRKANVPPDGETTRITHITQYGNQRDETFQPNSRWKTLPLSPSSSFLPPLLPFFLSPHTRRHTQTHTPQCHRRGPTEPPQQIHPPKWFWGTRRNRKGSSK